MLLKNTMGGSGTNTVQTTYLESIPISHFPIRIFIFLLVIISPTRGIKKCYELSDFY